MTLLTSPMELSMLSLYLLHLDLTLYNSNKLLEFYHSISDFSLISLMCHMTLLSHPIIMPKSNLTMNILVSLK
jgi:hypothetical protein